MIFGIGHDIVENDRIKYLLNTYEQRFINKILSNSEQKVFEKKQDQVKFLAKRLAAKEAFAKACGTGLRSPIMLTHISIINNNLGKPSFEFSDQIQNWLTEKKIKQCCLSISDEIKLSSAFVILEC